MAHPMAVSLRLHGSDVERICKENREHEETGRHRRVVERVPFLSRQMLETARL
jgi:hypothetical protein